MQSAHGEPEATPTLDVLLSYSSVTEKTVWKFALAEKVTLASLSVTLLHPFRRRLAPLLSTLAICLVSGQRSNIQLQLLTILFLPIVAWSDDRLKSNFHRVRAKDVKSPARYSIAYFNQARRDFVLQGPLKK